MSGYAKTEDSPSKAKAVGSEAAVVVVDPYSSGRYLLYELKKRGVPIVCVRSSLKLGPFFMASYETHKDYFVRTHDFTGDLAGLVAELKAGDFEIKAVTAGCEPGVDLADMLSEAMGVASNGTELTWARKDKAGMQDRLKACGVPSAEQLKSRDIDECRAWVRERESRLGKDIAYPVVVKPTGGSGGEGVFFCSSEEDLVNAHKDLIGSTQTGSGEEVDTLALQEFLSGTEYIIDTCTMEGKHLCCAVWRYTKRKGVPWSPKAIVTQYQEIILSDDEVANELVNYVFKVLDAVGLRHGPCHTEVMFTPRGPILVEVNARMHGVQGPLLIEQATGTGLASYVADAMMAGWRGDGGLLKMHLASGLSASTGRWMYSRSQCAAIVMLVNHTEGFLKIGVDKSISSLGLASVKEIFPSVKEGGGLKQTIDLNTMAGYAILINGSHDQMLEDIAAIRSAEETGDFYKTSETPVQTPMTGPTGRARVYSTQSDTNSGSSWSASRPRAISLEKADEVWSEVGDDDGRTK